jgi:hypothetical protein
LRLSRLDCSAFCRDILAGILPHSFGFIGRIMFSLNPYAKNVLLGLMLSVFSGCDGGTEPTAVAISGQEFHLGAEPENPISVLQLKESAKDGDPVVLVGRVGGGQKPWIDGRAAFLVVDDGVAPACADEECGEECAHCAAALADATTMVKFVDAQGKVLPTDSRELLGVEDFQTVVVRGIAAKDQAGNVTVIADGIYIRR